MPRRIGQRYNLLYRQSVQNVWRDRKNMERETGIEPVTSSLGSWRSTAELLPLKLR